MTTMTAHSACPVCNNGEVWRITVGGGYGGFIFYGAEAEAEDMRRHKARWEQAVANKERAECPECHRLYLDADCAACINSRVDFTPTCNGKPCPHWTRYGREALCAIPEEDR